MYSQYEEERYILEICGDPRDLAGANYPIGRFLDIGSWHPTDKSNTRALFELGWSGVMIEPSPGPMLNLLNEYANEPRITLVQAAVRVEPGLMQLHVTDDAVSTADRKQYEQWKEVTTFRGLITVPALSVVDLFVHFGGDFEMVNIDVEGTSVDVFKEMLRIGPRPKCVVVEHDSRFVELSQIAKAGDYEVVEENGTNRVYRWKGTRE